MLAFARQFRAARAASGLSLADLLAEAPAKTTDAELVSLIRGLKNDQREAVRQLLRAMQPRRRRS